MTYRHGYRTKEAGSLELSFDVAELKNLVRTRRSRDRLSLRAAAAEAGVSFNALARVEKGYLPDLANFRRIVAWLGVGPERFFEPPQVRSQNTPDVIASHLSRDPHLSDEAAERIARLVADMYAALARRPAAAGIRLRAASTFTPEAADALGRLLRDLREAIVRR